MTIDETIAKEKEEAKRLRKIIETGYDEEISIEAIFCDDTDAIKEAYERFENCAKKHEQLAEWLEELKLRRNLQLQCEKEFFSGYEKGKNEGYNKGYADGSLSVTEEIRGKAIDDFANLIKKRKFDYIEQCLEFDDFVDRLAEQLKAGEAE